MRDQSQGSSRDEASPNGRKREEAMDQDLAAFSGKIAHLLTKYTDDTIEYSRTVGESGFGGEHPEKVFNAKESEFLTSNLKLAHITIREALEKFPAPQVWAAVEDQYLAFVLSEIDSLQGRGWRHALMAAALLELPPEVLASTRMKTFFEWHGEAYIEKGDFGNIGSFLGIMRKGNPDYLESDECRDALSMGLQRQLPVTNPKLSAAIIVGTQFPRGKDAIAACMIDIECALRAIFPQSPPAQAYAGSKKSFFEVLPEVVKNASDEFREFVRDEICAAFLDGDMQKAVCAYGIYSPFLTLDYRQQIYLAAQKAIPEVQHKIHFYEKDMEFVRRNGIDLGAEKIFFRKAQELFLESPESAGEGQDAA